MSSKVRRIVKRISAHPAISQGAMSNYDYLIYSLFEEMKKEQKSYEDYKARADLMSYPLNKRYR